ncbi:MAG: adenylate kinase family protein, partial [Wolbachia sp.]
VINRLKSRLVCLECKSVYSASSLKNDDGFVCMKCKSTKLERRIDDSDLSVINRRISEYHIQIKCLREYYKYKLLTINANPNVDQIRQEIERKISCNLI